jgi:ATP-dependent Zn protease
MAHRSYHRRSNWANLFDPQPKPAPMLSKHHRRRSTAYHEAGHAIVACVLRSPVKRILIGRRRIGRHGRFLGLVSYLGPPWRRD